MRIVGWALFSLLLAPLAVAEPIRMRVSFADTKETCVATNIQLAFERDRASSAIDQRYVNSSAGDWRHFVRSTQFLGLVKLTRTPIAEIVSVQQNPNGLADYEMTLRSGEVAGDFGRASRGKVFEPSILACPTGVDPEQGEKSGQCTQSHVFWLDCLSEEYGSSKRIAAKMSTGADVPVPNVHLVSGAREIDDAGWAAIQRGVQVKEAERFVEEQEKQAEWQRELAERERQRATEKAKGEQALKDLERWAKQAKVGTYAFCESQNFLTSSAPTVADLVFICDANRSVNIGIRSLLDNGWDIINETRTPRQSVYDSGFGVSLTLRKAR